ncbi:MAG: hypothetical protein IK099_03435 [Clostridia bacterium]|nr:hypothetical protein [Clostridia bacterium]
MAEETRNGKKTGIWGSVFLGLGALLLMGVVYVAAILLQMPDEEANAPSTPLTRMQPAAMNDAQALAALFGAPLPCLPGYAMAGSGTNADYEGSVARVATLQYSGVTITAVRPAAAAPLLLRKELSVEMQSGLSVLNLPALSASKGNARCVYLSGADAAYAVYAPQAAQEDFLSMLEKLAWTE